MESKGDHDLCLSIPLRVAHPLIPFVLNWEKSYLLRLCAPSGNNAVCGPVQTWVFELIMHRNEGEVGKESEPTTMDGDGMCV